MGKLSKTQKEAIQKMGQSRLIVKLMPEEEVDAMDRAEMLEPWTVDIVCGCTAAGKDKPAVAPTLAYDMELERQKLYFQIGCLRHKMKQKDWKLESRQLLNLPKCEFAKVEVKYVGQYIGSGKRKPDPAKLTAILYMAPPTILRNSLDL